VSLLPPRRPRSGTATIPIRTPWIHRLHNPLPPRLPLRWDPPMHVSPVSPESFCNGPYPDSRSSSNSPISAYWSFPVTPDQRCVCDGLVMKCTAILNTFAEFTLAFLPAIAVYRLRVDPKQRSSVIGLLSLGFLVSATGCVRTFFVWKVVNTFDYTWWSTPHWICSQVEINMALVCIPSYL
jgi:hypothetical protein